MLERVWVRETTSGDGTLFIVSGYANYNGGVRFFDVFRSHIQNGGRVVAVFGGNSQQRLTSRQVVTELLNCGAEVHIVNRKRLMHAKSYGVSDSKGQMLVVTSGNFTAPGMSQNVEMSLLLDRQSTSDLGFNWVELMDNIHSQNWFTYKPTLGRPTDAVWQLLYDEKAANIVLDETDEVTMILTLGHADTARIMATPGTNAAKGTQYFWLSKDCYDFFPPLTIPNQRGHKPTYSCLVNMHYADLGAEYESRVTFEAENNLDFRLGTGPLRCTRIAKPRDLATITRVGEQNYELRLFPPSDPHYSTLASHAVHFIGHKGKRYGFIENEGFYNIIR